MPYKDPKKKSENQRKYAAAHPEVLRAIRRRNYLKHKERILNKTGAYYQANREKVNERMRFYNIKKKYGINKSTFIKLLANQNGQCCVCQCEIRLSGKIGGAKFNVDHDHKCCNGPISCGKCIRGIICGSCNIGLGAFKDNLSLLKAAVSYLESHTYVRP